MLVFDACRGVSKLRTITDGPRSAGVLGQAIRRCSPWESARPWGQRPSTQHTGAGGPRARYPPGGSGWSPPPASPETAGSRSHLHGVGFGSSRGQFLRRGRWPGSAVLAGCSPCPVEGSARHRSPPCSVKYYFVKRMGLCNYSNSQEFLIIGSYYCIIIKNHPISFLDIFPGLTDHSL